MTVAGNATTAQPQAFMAQSLGCRTQRAPDGQSSLSVIPCGTINAGLLESAARRGQRKVKRKHGSTRDD